MRIIYFSLPRQRILLHVSPECRSGPGIVTHELQTRRRCRELFHLSEDFPSRLETCPEGDRTSSWALAPARNPQFQEAGAEARTRTASPAAAQGPGGASSAPRSRCAWRRWNTPSDPEVWRKWEVGDTSCGSPGHTSHKTTSVPKIIILFIDIAFDLLLQNAIWFYSEACLWKLAYFHQKFGGGLSEDFIQNKLKSLKVANNTRGGYSSHWK